jgi:hypothetical protein
MKHLMVAALMCLAALRPSSARAQLDFSEDISSLTGMREAEMLDTYAFARERPRMYAPVELLRMPLTPYTEFDDERPWTERRVDTALRYARWTAGRCGIVLDRGPLQQMSRADMNTSTEAMRRDAGHGETLVFFVNEVPGRYIGSLGASKTKYPFPHIFVEDGVPVLTVLPHLVGKRLNVTTSDAAYSMMLTDRTLKEAFGSALTAAGGFFDPRRFGFGDNDCNVMREALLRETQCAPRAYVYKGRGDDRWDGTVSERRRARRGRVAWPFGGAEPEDLMVSPVLAHDGLYVFARQEGVWRGFFWRYDAPISKRLEGGAVEPYQGFEVAGGLGLGVHPVGQELSLVTFAEGKRAQVTSTPWQRPIRPNTTRPMRSESVPCDALLTSGPAGREPSSPLVVVCNDKLWRVWKGREPESTPLPASAKWATLTRRCNDDAQLWIGTDRGPMLLRIPAFGPLEAEPMPPWTQWPAVHEIPFTATWGGTPRSLDRVAIREFVTDPAPHWAPAVSEPPPTERGVWVRFEDAHGPGWAGWVDGKFVVE